jgi:hypothetical protein
MKPLCWLATLLFGLMPLGGAAAEPDGPKGADEPSRAAGIDIFASSDADHSNAVKLGATYDFAYTDLEHHQGVRLEEFLFATRGSRTTTQERGYFTFADAGARWKWNGNVGTDGHNVLGSGSIYVDEDFRQEYFVSRDLIETPLGVARGVYSTYVGAAYDLPLDDKNTVTALVGVQDFGGENKRVHLRGRYIYTIAPEWGLSVQLRTRYFWNSVPRELDYFSPRSYFEAIPTIQLRRFYNRWQYIAALGWGARQDSGTQWHSSALASASVTSPKFGQDWHMKAEFTYSNMPVSAGYTYDYAQVVVSAFKRF